MRNPISHTKDEVIEVFSTAISIADAARKLGLSGNNYRKVHFLADHYGLEKPVYQASVINAIIATRMPLEAILINGSYYSTSELKKRLVRSGQLIYVCEHCRLDPDTSVTWEGITLQLDHVNGNSADNRIENLRILCPNCHTQTETYGKGAGKKYKNGKNGKCTTCKRRSPHAEICWRCDNSSIEFPGIETVFLLLQNLTISEVASKIGISEDKLKNKMMGYAKQIVDVFGDNEKIANTSPLRSFKKMEIVKIDDTNITLHKKKAKADYPPIPDLLLEISQSSFTTVAARLGVSDNAVRKYIERTAGKDAVPRGYAKNPKPLPISAGREYLANADVNDIIAKVETIGENIGSVAASIHVDPKYLRSWLDSQLGYKYVAPRNQPRINPHHGKVVYPPVETLLAGIAMNGYEATARALEVSTRAIDKHLRKHLPASSFPLSTSGILEQYRFDNSMVA